MSMNLYFNHPTAQVTESFPWQTRTEESYYVMDAEDTFYAVCEIAERLRSHLGNSMVDELLEEVRFRIRQGYEIDVR